MPGPKYPVALAFVLVLALLRPAGAAEVAGKVVAIADGDTLTLLTADKRRVKLRLAEVDAPEDGQPWGARAKRLLSDLAFGREARGVVTDTDRYGRLVVRLRADGVDVNAELVRQGAAWVYVEYNTDAALPPLEAEARAARRGLWALPEKQRVPPWEWRRAGRDREPEARWLVEPTPPAQAFACGTKRTCREMADCAEARLHLERCGLSRLDSDGDGTPCEALCRR